eukprot:SAG31_NODE_924_length_10963_cov_4.339286_6_plen_57_part_00
MHRWRADSGNLDAPQPESEGEINIPITGSAHANSVTISLWMLAALAYELARVRGAL